MKHFLVCFRDIVHISPETVLVERLVGTAVPETGSVRGNFIGHDDLSMETAELQLEFNQLNIDASEVLLEDGVHLQGGFVNLLHILGGGSLHGVDMGMVDHGIQVHIGIAHDILHHRLLQLHTDGKTSTQGQLARDHVADLDGEGEHFTALDEAVARIDPADEMAFDAMFRQEVEQGFTNLVIHFALAENAAALEPVEGHCFIFKENNRLVRVVRCVDFFPFSFPQNCPDLRHRNKSSTH